MIERAIDHVGSHHPPTIGDGGRHHAHVQRHHRVVCLAEPADRQQRQVVGEVDRLATSVLKVAGYRARQIDRELLADSPCTDAGNHSLGTELDRHLRERDVAAAIEDLGHRSAARRAAVILDRVGGLRRQPLLLVGPIAIQAGDTGLESDARGDDLEARARHVALLISVGQHRLVVERVIEREICLGRGLVVSRDLVGIEAGVADHRENRPGCRVHHDDRAFAETQLLGRQLLQVGSNGQHHTAGVVAAAKHAGNFLGRRIAHQNIVVQSLELGAAEGVRVIAGDVAEGLSLWVLTLILEFRTLRRRHALRHHDTVGGDDGTAWTVEVADGLTIVLRVVVECFFARDLNGVERDEHNHVQHQQRGCELSNLGVHPLTTARTARFSARRNFDRSQRSPMESSSGTSPSRLALESLIRINTASRM